MFAHVWSRICAATSTHSRLTSGFFLPCYTLFTGQSLSTEPRTQPSERWNCRQRSPCPSFPPVSAGNLSSRLHTSTALYFLGHFPAPALFLLQEHQCYWIRSQTSLPHSTIIPSLKTCLQMWSHRMSLQGGHSSERFFFFSLKLDIQSYNLLGVSQ